MDRAIAITRLNTEEIAIEVNDVIKKGLDKLLGEHLYRYELLEKTHDAIMNLPSVRNHLNLQPLPQCDPKPVKNDVDIKYGQILEKLLIRIDELTYEVNKLKQMRKEDNDLIDEELVVVKLEQKENIKLEIEDVANEVDANEVDANEVDANEDEDEDEEAEDEDEDEEVEDEDEEVEDEEVEDEDEDNICSECDCKVILKEDIIIVDGKKHCGACDPSKDVTSESESEAEEEDEVETEESDSEEEEEEEETVSEVVKEEEAEEEYIEIDIDDVTYCTNNEETGFIYELTEDGEVGDKVGYLKDGEPFFYADEK
jgi:hypothetical protein